MSLKLFKKYLLFIVALASFSIRAQDNSNYIDNVIAIIGEEFVLRSDVEKQFIELKNQSQQDISPSVKCDVLNGIYSKKLLVYQAKVDSVEITEDEVENELDRRFRHYIQMLGSQENFERFYNKSIVELKDEFRIAIKEQLLQQSAKHNHSRYKSKPLK